MAGNKTKDGYWRDRERILNVMRTTSKRSEFYRKYSSASHAAREMGIYDELSEIMVAEGLWRPSQKKGWRDDMLTDEEILERASKYEYISDFIKNDNSAYRQAWRHGLLDKVCGRMKRKKKEDGYWNDKERCMEKASQYKMMHHFKYGCPAAFSAAKKNGWLDEIKVNMEKRKVFSLEEVLEVASKYDYVHDFAEEAPQYYRAASKHKWLEVVCKNMKRLGNWELRKIYVFEFSDRHAYVGLSFNPEVRKKVHLRDKKSSVFKHITVSSAKFVFKIISKLLPKDEAASLEKFYINEYRAQGWTVLNRSKGGELGTPNNHSFSNSYIEQIAMQYEHVADFRKEHQSLYVTALHRGIWLDIKRKMKTGQRRFVWNNKKLKSVLKPGMTKNSLKKSIPGAYVALRDMGLLPILFPQTNTGGRHKSPVLDIEKVNTLLK